MAGVHINFGVVGNDVRRAAAVGDDVMEAVRLRTCSRIISTACPISITASSDERPLSGAPAACAACPWKRNFAEIFASDDFRLALLASPGCQARITSQSLKTPARAM